MTQSRFSRTRLAALARFGIALLALTPLSAYAKTTSIFSFTGGNQSFVVPADVTSLTVKLWGAGGGAGGGSAAFVTGLLSVTPGNTLTLIVGGGGAASITGGFGGGGNGDSGFGGGGGRSAIRLNSTELVTAGGGGGHTQGGAGGLLTGGSGVGVAAGSGGTQSAGGSGSFPGSQFQGGNSTAGNPGGGGGGGYYGGGGGAFGYPGGGGSSFLDNLTASGASQAGRQGQSTLGTTAPGGASDPDYAAGIGRGASISTAGGNGRIVLIYTTVAAPEPGTLILLSLGGTLVIVKQRRRKIS